jgi:DNA invertase Pin-like site-specific DNA recombinase
MLERQREGIAKAKDAGKYKGRKPTVAIRAEAIKTIHAGGTKPAHIARQLGIARSSVYRMLAEDDAAHFLQQGEVLPACLAFRTTGQLRPAPQTP